MKTYSIALQNKEGVWLTNWHQYAEPSEINWSEVYRYSLEVGNLAYGYYYGHNSRDLTSARCRTVVKRLKPEPAGVSK